MGIVKDSITFVIDFDGTVVTHEYPRVGVNIGAEEVLRELIDNNHKIILFTMRSGRELDDAVEWFSKHDIELYGINTHPNQKDWTSSPKAHGDISIDDRDLFTPLTKTLPNGDRYLGHNFVDWIKVKDKLKELKIIL